MFPAYLCMAQIDLFNFWVLSDSIILVEVFLKINLPELS